MNTLPFRARRHCAWVTPGRCPGLGAFGPSARANIVSKNVHDFEHPTLLGAPTIGRGNPGRCPGLGAGCPFGARQHWFKKIMHGFGSQYAAYWRAKPSILQVKMQGFVKQYFLFPQTADNEHTGVGVGCLLTFPSAADFQFGARLHGFKEYA